MTNEELLLVRDNLTMKIDEVLAQIKRDTKPPSELCNIGGGSCDLRVKRNNEKLERLQFDLSNLTSQREFIQEKIDVVSEPVSDPDTIQGDSMIVTPQSSNISLAIPLLILGALIL